MVTTASETSTADTLAGRARILDVAAALFVEQGYDATSLRQIADAVGMKAGSLYYHFDSKGDLLTAVLDIGMDVMHTAFDAAENSTVGVPAPERIEAHVRAHLAALYEYGPYTAAHVVTLRTAPEAVRGRVVPSRDAYESRWAALLETMQTGGDLDEVVDTHIARLALFGAMNSSVEWFDPDRGGLDEVAGTIAHQFWNGVSR